MEIQAAGKRRILSDRLSVALHRLFVKPLLGLYLRRTVTVRHDGFRVTVNKGVFHPLLFFSTKYLYGFVKDLELSGCAFAEVGCGSGLLSLLAARKGARVTAFDIDERAVTCARENFQQNLPHAAAVVLRSDLFSEIEKQTFDVIVINPPYYFREVAHPDQHAWYCGAGGQYFVRLFSGLPGYMHASTKVIMVLEENCEIERIAGIAQVHNLQMKLVGEQKFRWETSYLFSISPQRN